MRLTIFRTGPVLLALAATCAGAANSPPFSESWNIASTGRAASSGELLFRVTPSDGSDPVEITVGVNSGTSEAGVAGDIRRAFSTQLRHDLFNVEPGQGANVVVTGQSGDRDFAVELIDSSVENVRVIVQSAEPVVPPTVPRQGIPANPAATPATPPAPGDVVPPAAATAPSGSSTSPPASNTAPPASGSPPASSTAPPVSGSAEAPTGSSPSGAGASAPPPR